jgi:hypothetical protein
MRMLLHVKVPHDAFNAAVKDGSAGKKMRRILDELKPEAVYFTEYGGRRGAIIIINVDDPSKVPSLAEPWFLTFNADCEFHVVMTPEDLARAGLDELGKKWA